MRVRREQQIFVLRLSPIECQVLRQLLTTMIENYRARPENIDLKARSAWYSTRGCESARMSREDIKEWLEALYGYKSRIAGRLENWRNDLVGQQSDYDWRIQMEDAPILLTALNDHRLLLAARHDIGQAEMDLHAVDEFVTLKREQQNALHEIHFLGWIMEVLLRLLDEAPNT